jgi:hypothetical protein
LIIGLMILRGLWRDAGDAARRRQLEEMGWQQIVDPGLEIALAPIDAPATEHVPARVDLGLLTAGERSFSALRQAASTERERPRFKRGEPLRLGRLGEDREDVALGSPAHGDTTHVERHRPGTSGRWDLHVRRRSFRSPLSPA